ncbi:unnamed protein product [Ascophyllum nodosum]
MFMAPAVRSQPAAIRDEPDPETLEARCGLLTMWEIQAKNLAAQLRSGIILTTLFVLAFFLWLRLNEAWTTGDTIYFLVLSLLTIGYGDIVVDSGWYDRLADSFMILLGLWMLAWWGNYVLRASSNLRFRPVFRPPPDFDMEASLRRIRRGLIIRLLLVTAVVAVGSFVFMFGEDKSFATSLYWAIVTSSTVGYGDVVPTTDAMKWFTVFYSIVATGSVLEALRRVGSYPFRTWNVRASARVINQFRKPKSEADPSEAMALANTAVREVLKISPREEQGGITRSDFTLAMLLMLDRVSYEHYQQAARVYDNLRLQSSNGVLPMRASATPSESSTPK